jgi:hypothetical protein
MTEGHKNPYPADQFKTPGILMDSAGTTYTYGNFIRVTGLEM